MEDARNNEICDGQYGSWLRAQAAKGGKQGDLQDGKLVKKGGHQFATPVEKKNPIVGQVSEVRGQKERMEVERGDENAGKEQEEAGEFQLGGEESE